MPAQQPTLSDRILSFHRALTVVEVAELLNVSGPMVYKQARAGDIPSFRVGSSVRFDPKLLTDWLARQ